jgi:hypothetical protein
MNQILHIFRKDVRRHWPDIVVALAVLAAYAWHQTGEWHPRDITSQMLHDRLLKWLPFAVVLAWSFLIARVVLAESLVGERQFWITRPYDWRKLLTAKLLYLVAFFSFPLLLIQAILLWRAGFSPTPYLAGLLLLALWWVSLVIPPVMTLAVVTSNIAQFFLVVLGIAASIIGIAIFGDQLQRVEFLPAELIPEWVGPTLLLAAAIMAIILQYARRRTLQSRLLLFSVGTAVIIVSLIQKEKGFLIREYPQLPSAERLPIQISLDPSVSDRGTASIEYNKIPVRIPLIFSGMAENSVVYVNGAMVDIEAPGAMHWNSGWFGMHEQIFPSREKLGILFTVDKSFFEPVKSTSVTLHIFLALTTLRSQETRRVMATAGDFEALGGAVCSMWRDDASSLHCRAPLRKPSLAVSVFSQESTCPLDEGDEAPSAGFDWEWNSDTSPVELDLSPVQTFDFSFWRMQWEKGNRHNFLCPGTPLNFQTLREVQRARTGLRIDGIRLADYQPKEQSDIWLGVVTRAH